MRILRPVRNATTYGPLPCRLDRDNASERDRPSSATARLAKGYDVFDEPAPFAATKILRHGRELGERALKAIGNENGDSAL